MTIAAGRDCVLGVDVSVYQTSIDWNAVAACRQFAVIKASGGDGRGWSNYPDGMFAAHRANSRGHLPRGAYHFLGGGNGAAQADYFVRATGGYQDLELPPVVDVEIEGLSQAVVSDFVNEIHRQVGRRWIGPTGEPVALIIYTGASWAKYMQPTFNRFDLWLAAYLNPYYGNPWNGVTNTATPAVHQLGSPDRYVPWPWSAWSAWQFAGGDGGCPGVGNGGTNCDQNVMTVGAFQRLTNNQEQDWLDMATKAEVQEAFTAALCDPRVAQNFAYWINNIGASQGAPDALPGASIQTVDAKLQALVDKG